MAVSHIFSSPVADMTGTVTVFDSNGNTATTNATVLVRPSNWNSVHNQFLTISGNTSGQSTASGTNLVLQGGNNVTLSVTDQTIIFSASQSQSVQTQNMVSVQGSTGAISFANSNGITFGGNASTITASHNGLTSQSNQAFSAAGGSSAFQTLSFADSQGVSWSNSNGSVVATVRTNYAASDHSHGNPTLNLTNISGTTASNSAGLTLSLSAGAAGAFSAGISGGNTAGDTGTVSNQIVFAGGNNITVSGSTNAGGMSVTISGANAGGAQTGISGIVVSDTTYTSGTVSFSNAGNITISSSVNGATQYIRLSGNPAQTNVAFSADASSTFQTLTFQNSNNVSFSNNAGAIRVTHNLAGTSTGTAGNNIGLSMTLNSSGLNLSATVAAQTNQTLGIYGSSQTTGSASSGTHDARSLSFIGAGIISVGNHSTSAGGTTTGVIISATQSNQAFSAGAASSAFQTLVFQDSNGLSFSNNAGSIRVSYTRNVASNAIQSVGSATGSGTNTSRFAADDHVHAGVFSMGVSTGGNTAGDTRVDVGRFVLFGGNNITLSQATAANALNTISIVGGAGGGGFTGGMSNIGNTAGTSGTVQSQMLVVGGPNITVSQSINGNSATLSISGNAPGAAAENNNINLLGANTAGNTTASGSTIGLSGLNLTLSGTNASQIVFSAPATSSLVGFRGLLVSTNGSTISVGHDFESYYENMPQINASTWLTVAQSTSHVVPFQINDALSANIIRLFVSASVQASSTAATTGNSQFSYGLTRSHNFVIYSRGVGASSLSLQSVTSTQHTDRQSINVSANANSTQFSYSNRASLMMSSGTSGYTFDYSSSAASLNFHTSNMTGVTGLKVVEMPFAMTLLPGAYWLVYGLSSSTNSQFNAQGSRLFMALSNFGVSQINAGWGTWNSATNNSVHLQQGLGSFTTNVGGTTASLGLSNITTSASQNKMYFHLQNLA